MKIAIVVLLLLLSLCQGTEYYVRPTDRELANASCAGQPCLTLSQYIGDSSIYFKSNTVFRFLPGLHHANEMFEMQSLENVSLEGEQNGEFTMIVLDISCSSGDCAGIRFLNISNLTVQSLNIAIHAQVLPSFSLSIEELPLSGFILSAVSNLSMYQTTVEFSSSDFLSNSSGIMMFACYHILAHSLTLKEHGLYISHSQYATLSNISVQNAQESGIYLESSIYMNIVNVRVSESGLYGIDISYVHHITFVNISVAMSFQTGISVIASKDLAFFNAHVMLCGTILLHRDEFDIDCFGFKFEDVNSVELYYVTVEYSKDTGITIRSSHNVTIVKTTVTNVLTGISSTSSSNTHISHTTIDCSEYALSVSADDHCVIANVTVITQFYGPAVSVSSSRYVQIENISLSPIKLGFFQQEAAVKLERCNEVIVSKSIFANFSTSRIIHSATDQPAVFLLTYSKNIHFSHCTFVGNNVSALKLVNAEIIVSDVLNFTHNTAYRGAAIVFAYNSKVRLSQDSNVFFVGNHAILTGGAIYLITSHYYIGSSAFVPFCFNYTYMCRYTPECFFVPKDYPFYGRLTFVNNTAGQGGDVLYGRVVSIYIYFRDGISSIPCSLLFEEISNITPNTSSQVASDPIQVCYCEWGLPDCDVVSIEGDPIFPGQSITVPAIVVGYEGGTVAGSVFANFLLLHSRRSQLQVGENTQKVTQVPCNELEYTILTANTEEVLVLSTVNQEDSLLVAENADSSEFPLYVNISLSPCPPGFTLLENPGRCDCSDFLLQLPGVSCNIKNVTIQRSELVWIGGIKDENQTVVNVITAGYCPLNYCKHNQVSIHLDEPDSQCEFNHSGTLCGGCQPGLSLILGGVQCQVCSNTNIALLIPFVLAGVVLVLFLKIFNLTTAEGFINSLVFYANIVKANEHIFLPQTNGNPLTLFIAWLNLDLGIQTCFFNGLSAYTKTWLQFVFPFYIWGIAGVIIISARYSIRIARVTGNNSVPVLATLFLLSYAKLLRIIITTLSYTVLDYPGGQKVVWSADGNIEYLGPKHAPLFAAALATLLFLWLPYTMLLFLGQWLYKCSKLRFVNHILIKLKPFLDAHYGPLQDSYRFWFGTLLLVRAIILLISALVIKNNFSVFVFSISMATIILVIVLVVFFHVNGGLRVYHNKAVSLFEFLIFTNLVVLSLAKYHSSVGGGNEVAASYTLTGIVFLKFIALLIIRIYSAVKKILSHYFPMNTSQAGSGVWRYENSIEMHTRNYRNANNVL